MSDKAYYEDEWNKHIKEVEENMGMSLDTFHQKLDELLTPQYIEKSVRYKTVLDKWLESGRGIYTDKGDELILKDGEYFEQCFSPDIPGRNELYPFWFISNRGNLVSAYGNKVTWLPMIPHDKDNESDRMCYKWLHPVTKVNKNIQVHNLMALVFNPGASFGRAKEDIKLFGTYAFGVGYGFWLNGHHRYRYNDYPDKVFDPKNIQFLRGYVHDALRDARKILTKIHANSGNPENEENMNGLLIRIARMLDVEAPGMIVLTCSGELYNMDGTYRNNKGEYFFNLLTADEVITMLSETKEKVICYSI